MTKKVKSVEIEIETLHDHPLYPILRVTTEYGKEYFIHCERDHAFRVFDTKLHLEEMMKWGHDKAAMGTFVSKKLAIEFIKGEIAKKEVYTGRELLDMGKARAAKQKTKPKGKSK